MYDKYVEARIIADVYATGTADYPGKGIPGVGDFERRMRWQISVEQVMKIHREICKVVGVPYSTESSDEFYNALFNQSMKDAKPKG